MPRIAGIDLQDKLKVQYALTDIYGVGPNNALKILNQANVDLAKRASQLTDEETMRIQRVLDRMLIGGDLRAKVSEDIRRLKRIGSYRGLRHSQNLPVRGQQTRTNARTKRGKRQTIGAISKKVAQKMGIETKKESKEK